MSTEPICLKRTLFQELYKIFTWHQYANFVNIYAQTKKSTISFGDKAEYCMRTEYDLCVNSLEMNSVFAKYLITNGLIIKCVAGGIKQRNFNFAMPRLDDN